MPGAGFADLDRAHDVGMLHALAVARFAQETRDGGAILPQLFAQHFHGNGAVVGMLRAEDGGRSAFADFALQRVSGDRLADEVFAWHAANLIAGAMQACASAMTLLIRAAMRRLLDKYRKVFLYRAPQARRLARHRSAGSIHPVGGSSHGQREGEVVQ